MGAPVIADAVQMDALRADADVEPSSERGIRIDAIGVQELESGRVGVLQKVVDVADVLVVA